MKVIWDLASVQFEKKTIVTIGTFDGVHLGHQKIIKRLLASKNEDCQTVIISFRNHPRLVLQQESNLQLLNSNEEKIRLLEHLGVDCLVLLDFNQALANLSGEDFVQQILVEKLNMQKLIIGYDHKFGKNRSSDIYDLIAFGRKYHFDVEQISAQELDEITISSTKIRTALQEGNVRLANSFLGYPYSFEGTVVKGNQIGRTIGFPTANISLQDSSKLMPKNGVYAVRFFLNDAAYNGMMNIGIRPTIEGLHTVIEVHLFDCAFEFYDAQVVVQVLERFRDERKFESLEALTNQLGQDESLIRDFFDNNISG